MAEEKEEQKEGEVQAKPKGKKKLFIIIGIVVLLLAVGVPLLFLGGDAKEHDPDYEAEPHYETAKLDTFIVNLSEPSTFLKTTILVEYDPDAIEISLNPKGGKGKGKGHAGGGAPVSTEPQLHPHFNTRKPMIHDAVIRILSSKKSSEVLTSEGKERLKFELIDAINDALGLDEAPVVNIYFTEFIIQ